MTTPANTPGATPKRPSKMASSQSLNHLLNFSLPPRQSHQPQSLPRRTRRTGNQNGFWNKERYVNAQYRFVMNPNGDYTVHFADPDIFFQWHDILQVIIPRNSALASAAGSAADAVQQEGVTTCPICLSPPTAPRMTNTSDNLKWVRCPICLDSVNERQLKAVKWFDEPFTTEDCDDGPPKASSSSTSLDGVTTTPSPGSTLRMRLIERPQITTLALPRSQTWPSDLLPPHQAPFHFLPDVFAFAKFMLATPAYLITDLTRDLDELVTERRMLASMGDHLGVSFVDAADAKLRHQLEKAAALESSALKEAIDGALHTQQQIQDRFAMRNRRRVEQPPPAPRETSAEEIPEAFLATRDSPGFGATLSPNPPTTTPTTPTNAPSSTPTVRNPRQRRNLNPPPPSTSTYYYYQAASGLPVFLHPLDIRILLAHFHSYAAFPDGFSVRVESYAETTVNDDLRKRCKYLAHMPEGADVVFVEADLEGVVGAEGVRGFEGALKMRRARRKEKGKKDEKARVRAEEREREKGRERGKEVLSWADSAAGAEVGHVVLSELDGSPLLPVGDEFPDVQAPARSSSPSRTQQQQHQRGATGAWGARSFASAAHAASARPAGQQQQPLRGLRREIDEDLELDLDAAFHELEQRNRGGGRKRNNRMVVLGGGNGGRRR